MTQKPPAPVVKAFLVCDTVIHDAQTGKKSIIGVFHELRAHRFPAVHPVLWIYANLTDSHGRYAFQIRFLDVGRNQVLGHGDPPPIDIPGPLQTTELAAQLRNVALPGPGTFEFQRPNQFRFAYAKPAEQLIVADGKEVWIYDPDLQQATVRQMDQALGATPVALLAGGDLSRDFTLKALPAANGLDWVQATPRRNDSGLQSLKLGFKGRELSALEIVDGFGQQSVMQFSAVEPNAKVSAERFRFTPPPGTDIARQP